MSKLRNEIEYIKVRNKVTLDIENLMSNLDYIKVEPDYFESYDWFLNANTLIRPTSMVKFINPKGEVQLLRPDITTNIIKQLSSYWESDSFYKLYYNATTFRQSKEGITQMRQFGIEQIGDSSFNSEVELLQLINTIFSRFSPNFILSVGNQKVLDNLLSSFSKDKITRIKKAISKRDITTYKELVKDEQDEMLQRLFDLNGDIDSVISLLKNFKESKMIREYSKFLLKLKGSLSEEELSMIDTDLALVSEYDYYCGIVFQGYLRSQSKPILSGGRYDKLTGKFGKEIPAIGVSFDLTSYIKEVTNE